MLTLDLKSICNSCNLYTSEVFSMGKATRSSVSRRSEHKGAIHGVRTSLRWWVVLLLIVDAVIIVIGTLLCGVGLLAAAPIVACITTAAYRQLFGTTDHTSLLGGESSTSL